MLQHEWPWRHHTSEIGQTKKDDYCMTALTRSITHKSIQSLRDRKLNSGWGTGEREDGELLFNGQSFSLGCEKILEVDNGDGFNTMWMYLMPLNCMLNNVKVVNFLLCIFYHNKIILKKQL